MSSNLRFLVTNKTVTRLPGILAFCVDLVVVGLLALFGLVLAERTVHIATIWPANGVLLAILLTSRPTASAGYLGVGFLLNMTAAFLAGFPPQICLRIGLVNLAEVAFALGLINQFVGKNCDLSQPKQLWRFALAAAVIAPALAMVLKFGLASFLTAPSSAMNFVASYLSHALGIITVTPFALAARRGELPNLIGAGKVGRTALAFGVLIGVSALVFAQSRYPLLFMVFPPLVLVVALCGLAGGALGLFLVTLIAIGFTVAGNGPITLVSGAAAVDHVVIVQLFVTVAAVLVFVLAATFAERDRAESQLRGARDTLAQLATTDALTGLANRRRLDEALERECRRASRDHAPLSFLMLDVDRFKAYNDRYGHQAGDECLRAIGSVVKSFGRRPGDLAARYGGEEMAIVLSATDEIGATKTAAALRAAIEALGLPHDGNRPGGGVVTASIGVATATPNDIPYSPEALIGAADELLYEAKRTGRNRIMTPALRPVDPVPPPLPNEDRRVAAVEAFQSTAAQSLSGELDAIARLAAKLLDTPIGLVSLVGRDHQVFVGRYGLDVPGTGRDVSFCAHVMTGDSPMVVPNADDDPRFMDNPLVTGDLNIRFYAGAPLVSAEGDHHLGALCAIDRVARPPLTEEQRTQLGNLAAIAMTLLERENAMMDQGAPAAMMA